jgi:hypothetical protein
MSLFPNLARLSASEKAMLPFATIWIACCIGGLGRVAYDALGIFPTS